MTNATIDVSSDKDLDLDAAMAIAFRRAPGGTAEAWAETPAGLVFFWTPNLDHKVVPIRWPFKLDAKGGADFARRWLNEQDYGPEPDHDGVNAKGWRVYNEQWGVVDGMSGSFLAVQPKWIEYGK